MTPFLETLAALLRRHCDDQDEPPDVARIGLAAAIRAGDDPLHIIPYLATLGHTVACLEDLLKINEDPDEDDLHSFRVAEGVAVTVVSDGLWLLFEH